MTNTFDALGLPLQGAILIPDYEVWVETRGSEQVLAWKRSNSPPVPSGGAEQFLSLPRLIDRKSLQKIADPGLRRLMAMPGVSAQTFRTGIPLLSGAGVLDDFLRLGALSKEALPKAVRVFASYWGPLGICKHLIPWTHSFSYRALSATEICAPLGVRGSRGSSGWEPLTTWADLAREASAIEAEARRLKGSRERPIHELNRLFRSIERWLLLAGVPLVSNAAPDSDAPWPCGLGVTFAISGVFQIVAIQLLSTVAGSRGLATCSHCGTIFGLTGHREGARRFCPACIEQEVPGRYAAQDYRARKKAAEKLA